MRKSSLLSLPVLPLRNTVLFPHLEIPLVVGRESSVAAVDLANATEDKFIAVFAQHDPSINQPRQSELHSIGTKATILKVQRHNKGGIEVILRGVERISLISIDAYTPYLRAMTHPLPTPSDEGPEVEALHRSVQDLTGKLDDLIESRWPGFLPQMLQQFQNPLIHVYLLASLFNLDLDKKQVILEADTRYKALQLIYDQLTHELRVLELRKKIASDTANEMTKAQKEYVLRQQMQAIQKELGEGESARSDLDQLRDKLLKGDLPPDIRKEAERELSRLQQMPQAAPDYQMTRSYLPNLQAIFVHYNPSKSIVSSKPL